MADGLPSLDLLHEEVHAERDAMLRHTDAVDTKAGVVLGFSGVLVAIATNSPTWWTVPGLTVAVVAAVFAVRAFVPRRFQVLDVGSLRNRYLRSHERLTTLRLLDTEIALIQKQKKRLEHNASSLKRALWTLVLAAALLVGGTIVHLSRS